MDLHVKGSQLLGGLRIIQNGISAKSTVELLQGVYIEANKDGITLIASNAETYWKCNIAATVHEEGRVCINHRMFMNMVSHFRDDTIHLSTREQSLFILNKDTEIQLQSLNAELYPLRDDTRSGQFVELPVTLFSDMLKATIFATNSNDHRLLFTGVKFQFKEDEISAVAMDGYKIAYAKSYLSNRHQLEMIIPANILNQILSSLDNEDMLKLHVEPQGVILTSGNLQVHSPTINVQTMEFHNLLYSQEDIMEIKVNRSALLKSIGLLTSFTAMAKEQHKPVLLKVTKNLLHLSCENEQGIVQDTLSCRVDTQDEFKIGFNAKYIKQILDVIDHEEVLLRLKDHKSHGVILPSIGESSIYIVAPVIINL